VGVYPWQQQVQSGKKVQRVTDALFVGHMWRVETFSTLEKKV